MKEVYFFQDENLGYSDYLKIIKEKIENNDISSIYDNFTNGIEALSTIDEDKKQLLINTSIEIDRNLTPPHSKNANTKRKVLTMMTVAGLIGSHYEDIKHLNKKQLAVLGEYLHCYDISEIDTVLHVFANSDLLNAVINKTKDSSYRYEILTTVGHKCPKECYNKDNLLEINDFQRQMIDIIENNSLSEIMRMQMPVNQMTDELASEGIKF